LILSFALRLIGTGIRTVRHYLNLQRTVGIKMDIALRKRNDDAGLAKLAVDGFVQLMAGRHPVVDVGDKYPQLKIQAVIPETQKIGSVFWIFEHQGIFIEYLQQ